MPKSKKLAEICYQKSPNQRIARFLIASQQFFVSSVVMTLVATIVATSFILLENTIGQSEVIPAILLVSGLALATLPAFAQNDLTRRV